METKTPIQVSVFHGFKKQVGNMSLTQLLNNIRCKKYMLPVERLRTHVSNGKAEEGVRVKRQLPAFTLSAIYEGKRLAEKMTAYNDILILDFDKLDDATLDRCKAIVVQAPETLFCYKSPSGNGLKVGVRYSNPEAAQLREALLEKQTVTTTGLERYHKTLFDGCRAYYEALCGVAIDPSGSDIGRLCFVSFDPDIYINTPAIDALQTPPLVIEPGEVAAKSRQEIIRRDLPGDKTVELADIPPHIQMEFQHCVNKMQYKLKYEPGQRDMYIYALGHLCYCKGIPQQHAELLAQYQYGGAEGIDVRQTIGNAYHYTNRTDRQESEKQQCVGVKIAEFLRGIVEARRNVVLDQLEIRPKPVGKPEPFRLVRREDYNTLYLDAQYAGINCQQHVVKTVLNSRFAVNYDPFEEYFCNLPPWDTQTDHIGALAQTMQTTTQAFWLDCFRRWIVGVVACALDEERENQLALIIKGGQGKGKSTWIRRLLPPALKHYYRNGMLNPRNKDHMILLSQRLIINLEEFERMKKEDLAELKRLIAQDSVTERKAYGEDATFYIRRASFIASTNESRFLEDISGTRRFPTVTAERIDFETPVNHAGVYAQALYLWKNGFKYWYDEPEFQELNTHNKQYVITSLEEELFYAYFRQAHPEDINARWMSVGSILSLLIIYGKIQSGPVAQLKLIKVLERDGFKHRTTKNGIVEYEVVFLVGVAD